MQSGCGAPATFTLVDQRAGRAMELRVTSPVASTYFPLDRGHRERRGMLVPFVFCALAWTGIGALLLALL